MGVRVYPRVCGGTFLVAIPQIQARGLSPRVRGNRRSRSRSASRWRSIPACAGEPFDIIPYAPSFRVYPRVCGGTKICPRTNLSWGGLSPRVRGNLFRHCIQLLPTGSIPACAGEPTWASQTCRRGRVYPRVCGGTRFASTPPFPFGGLSPRVRGNPQARSACWGWGGSIPACAGEP